MVHTSLKTFDFESFCIVCCQGYNLGLFQEFTVCYLTPRNQISDGDSRLETIHNRHVAVHQNEFVHIGISPAHTWLMYNLRDSFLAQFQSLLPIHRRVTIMLADLLEDRLNGNYVENVVINNEQGSPLAALARGSSHASLLYRRAIVI
jgi:hypothetical protein